MSNLLSLQLSLNINSLGWFYSSLILFHINVNFRWDLTRYPTSPVTQHVLKKYLNFGEIVYEKVEKVGNSVASNKNIQDMKRKMK